jgi:hypothetical protein
VRILFLRKNKTVAANFKTASVLDMLGRNHAAFCSLKGLSPLFGKFSETGGNVKDNLRSNQVSDSSRLNTHGSGILASLNPLDGDGDDDDDVEMVDCNEQDNDDDDLQVDSLKDNSVTAGVDRSKVKDAVMEILEKTGLGEMRASKMDIDDFLRLLVAFNEANFHFS